MPIIRPNCSTLPYSSKRSSKITWSNILHNVQLPTSKFLWIAWREASGIHVDVLASVSQATSAKKLSWEKCQMSVISHEHRLSSCEHQSFSTNFGRCHHSGDCYCHHNHGLQSGPPQNCTPVMRNEASKEDWDRPSWYERWDKHSCSLTFLYVYATGREQQ